MTAVFQLCGQLSSLEGPNGRLTPARPDADLLMIRESARIFVVGSVNIDHIYRCPSLPVEGGCVVAPQYTMELGGKGLNQAWALFQSKATDVRFHGNVGRDGQWVLEQLRSLGFPAENIRLHDSKVAMCGVRS